MPIQRCSLNAALMLTSATSGVSGPETGMGSSFPGARGMGTELIFSMPARQGGNVSDFFLVVPLSFSLFSNGSFQG